MLRPRQYTSTSFNESLKPPFSTSCGKESRGRLSGKERKGKERKGKETESM
jgi:hypothetical protein